MKKPEQETAGEGCVCSDMKGGRVEEEMQDSGSGSQEPQVSARDIPGGKLGRERMGTTRELCKKIRMIQQRLTSTKQMSQKSRQMGT